MGEHVRLKKHLFISHRDKYSILYLALLNSTKALIDFTEGCALKNAQPFFFVAYPVLYEQLGSEQYNDTRRIRGHLFRIILKISIYLNRSLHIVKSLFKFD